MTETQKVLLVEIVAAIAAFAFFIFILFHGNGSHHAQVNFMKNNKLYIPREIANDVGKYINFDNVEKQYDRDSGDVIGLVVTPNETQRSTFQILKAFKNNDIIIK